MAAIELVDVVVESGGVRVLDRIDLSIADGELVGVVGPSGSGKTMLLRTVAGLQPVTSGRVLFDGVDVTQASPGERDVSMAFQQGVLNPRRSVRGNVAQPFEYRGGSGGDVDARVDAELRAHGIQHLQGYRSTQLSPAEVQIVQLARSLVRRPQVLLLDDPFAALDDARRGALRRELITVQQGYAVTTLISLSDPLDVRTLPSRLVVIEGGRITQSGSAADVEAAPQTLAAAQTIASVSTIPARVTVDDGGHSVVSIDVDEQRIDCTVPTPALADRVGEPVLIAVRPADVSVLPAGASADVGGPGLPASVDHMTPGPAPELRCTAAGATILADVDRSALGTSGWRPGDRVLLRLERFLVIEASTGRVITAVG
jgi:ABC-type sugar transport system ATPase subunit